MTNIYLASGHSDIVKIVGLRHNRYKLVNIDVMIMFHNLPITEKGHMESQSDGQGKTVK